MRFAVSSPARRAAIVRAKKSERHSHLGIVLSLQIVLISTSGNAGDRRPNKGAFGKIMRRRLELFIPIVLLAVLVQLIAPIGAFRAVAHAVSDPLAMASICLEMTAAEQQTMPSHGPNAHADCCAFCAAGHSGSAAIDPPAPIFVNLQRQYQRVVWLEATEIISTARVGSNAQARAPPAFS
jgi:DUF2946 family protein